MKPWRRSGGVGCPSDQVTALVLTYDPGGDVWTWTWSGADPAHWQFRRIAAGTFVDALCLAGTARTTAGFGPGTFRLAGSANDPAGGVFTTVFSNTVDVF